MSFNLLWLGCLRFVSLRSDYDAFASLYFALARIPLLPFGSDAFALVRMSSLRFTSLWLGCLRFAPARMPLLSARLFIYLFAFVSLVPLFARTHSCLSWLATFFLDMLADFVSARVFRLGSHLLELG